MMKTAREIGNTLIALRGKQSRTAVAAAIGISYSTLVMYENGHRIPRDKIKVALAEYYNTTVSSLFFENAVHETCDYRGASHGA